MSNILLGVAALCGVLLYGTMLVESLRHALFGEYADERIGGLLFSLILIGGAAAVGAAAVP